MRKFLAYIVICSIVISCSCDNSNSSSQEKKSIKDAGLYREPIKGSGLDNLSNPDTSKRKKYFSLINLKVIQITITKSLLKKIQKMTLAYILF